MLGFSTCSEQAVLHTERLGDAAPHACSARAICWYVRCGLLLGQPKENKPQVDIRAIIATEVALKQTDLACMHLA